MKKLLVILLAFGLLVSLHAGGSRQAGAADGKMAITVGMWEFEKFGGDAVGDFIENKFNIDIQPILQEWSDYQETFRLWAASNQLPDTFSGYPPEEAWFADFVSQGLIRSIPYSMISKYPNLKKVVDNHSLTQDVKANLGDFYFIPRPLISYGTISNNMGIYYRKDWAEKLGYTNRPQDMETFYNMLRDFALKDPDGNGRNDTYGYTGYALNELYAGFGAFPGYWVKGTNNQYIPGWADEAPMIEALTWLRRAYSEGVLDPEFPRDYTVVASKFAQGTFGAMGRSLDCYWINRHVIEQFGGSTPGVDPMKAVDYLAAMSSRQGGTPYHAPLIDSSGIVFRHDISDAKLEKLLELYDWLISDEGEAMRILGIKDVDYRVNSDGSLAPIGNTDPTALREKYPSIIIQIWPAWGARLEEDVNEVFYPRSVIDAYREWVPVANTGSTNALNKVGILASVTPTDERANFSFNDGVALNAQLVRIISGSGDVATMYRAFIADANSRGLQDVIRSVNNKLK